MARYEFLPLCDVLFNIISLAAYFCDIVFDVVMGYALYSQGHYVPFFITMVFVGASATVEQTMSLRWYLAGRQVGDKSTAADRRKRLAVQALHFVQLGVLWRYVTHTHTHRSPPTSPRGLQSPTASSAVQCNNVYPDLAGTSSSFCPST